MGAEARVQTLPRRGEERLRRPGSRRGAVRTARPGGEGTDPLISLGKFFKQQFLERYLCVFLRGKNKFIDLNLY